MESLIKSLIPVNDPERLEALRRYQILDTPPEAVFDKITEMMAQVFDMPLAFLSIVGQERVHFKSRYGGFPLPEVLREDSLCSHTILSPSPLVIEDAHADACFANGTYVATEGGIRFYAGAPLITPDGHQIGTVCLVDTKPRTFSEANTRLLEQFAWMTMHQIEMREALLRQGAIETQLQEANRELRFVTDMMPQLVWATESDGYASYFNRMWTEYTGVPFGELTGEGWIRTLHPDDVADTATAWQNALRQQASYDVEYRVRRHDGTYRWFVARGTPMKDAYGNILRWYGTTTDIDEQKRAEERLEEKVAERTQQLTEARNQIRGVVDSAPIGMMVYTSIRDEAGRIVDFGMLYYNAQVTELTGITTEQRESLRLTELLGLYGLEDDFGRYVDVVEQGRSEAWQQHVPATGKWLWVTVTPLQDGFLRTLSDITELKESQEAVEKQSEFANSILDASINAVMALDAVPGPAGTVSDFRIVKINKAFTTIVGLDESIVGKNYRSYFPGTDKSGVFDLYRRVLQTGQPERKEIYSADQDLNSWFDISAVKRGDNGVVVTFNNISPQRQAAIRIEQQKNMLDNILRHSPSGISVTEMIRDAAGTIVDARTVMANEISAKHTGLPLELALSRTVSENLPGILESPLFVQALETLRTGTPFITQYFVEPTGRWIELAVAKMDEDRLINVFTDVTPIKEAQLRQEELVARLKRSNEELEQFTYVSHHDLQEPLRKILIFTDMVKSDTHTQLSEAAAARLEKVSASARRMSAALRDVLNYASLNKAEQFTEVDLDEVLAAVQSDLELVIQEKGARVSSDALPTMRAVPHQMHQLFYNLMNNALKFVLPGATPEIRVRCRILTDADRAAHPELDAHRTWYGISFSDNGIGFSPESAERIFLMFQRLHQREAYGGTGIGLALCRKVVQNHGGSIWAESKPGEGATFHILLPGPGPLSPEGGT
ncbi:PAS domain-containing protein [Flaviaesturariibacter amylovorans]|uniref:histidine kinase n=1 Tax=Flaviaesturariibacter amylovorans TaxID=1084520 RepID=A0ABP8HPN5_9BACT